MDYCIALPTLHRKEIHLIRKMGSILIGGLCLLAGAGIVLADAKVSALRIGLMPAYNSIPLVVAETRGIFRAQGVSVTLVPFSGQLERETALQTGAVDGTVSDMINAIQSWSHGFGARVTSVTEGNFALLGSPKGSLKTLSDWSTKSKVRTGLLENSIVYYLTERMLASGGADLTSLEVVPIVQLPARVEMLLAGRVDAACLPEPLATLAVSRGAYLLADSDGMGTTPGVLLFTKKALAEKTLQIIAFYRAYDAAVEEVNAHPDNYRQSIVAGCGFPPSTIDIMKIPKFRHAFLPPASLVSDVETWMKRKGLTENVPSYTDLVAPGFVTANARAQ
jgi:NitT/TauT family transport system substrate-binding protein